MVYSEYTKQRKLLHCFKRLKPGAITLKLEKERIVVSRVGSWKFIKRYTLHGASKWKAGCGQPKKITAEVFPIVNQEMDKDCKPLLSNY